MLHQLGVSSDLLSDDERRLLDERGYLVLDDVIPPERLEAIRARLAKLLEDDRLEAETDEGLRRQAQMRLDLCEKMTAERDRLELTDAAKAQFAAYLDKMRESAETLRDALSADATERIRAGLALAGGRLRQEEFILDLIGADPVFDLPLSTPRVLAAASHIIGPDMHLWGILCRTPAVGKGHQGLHRDPGEPGHMCNTLWLIDDMTIESGATRLVPGSHLSELEPADELDGDAEKTHPHEVKIEGKAGQAVVFNGRMWHGGTQRTGGGPRRLLISPFSVRTQFRDQPMHIDAEAVARLTDAQRWLLHLDDPKLAPGERAYAQG